MASILDLNPEMRSQIAQATAGGDENSGPYKFNPADFNLVNGQYIPKDEKAFRKMVGLRPNEKYQPIKEYQIQQQANDIVSTEPYNFQSKYGIEPQNFFSRTPLKISGQNSREEWLKAYESMKNSSELPRAYNSRYVKSGVSIEPMLGSNDKNERYLQVNAVGGDLLSPLSQRLFEYKNSDALLERLAGSHYNDQINIDKWTADPAYREEFTKKYLSENPDLAKKMLQTYREDLPISIVSQNPDSVGSAGHYGGFNKININPIFHGRNFPDRTTQLDEILKYAKTVYPKLSDKFKNPEQLASRLAVDVIPNTNTPDVLSHEAGHTFFNKKNLVEKNNLPLDQVYPENKMIWELNQATKGGKMDYQKFKDLLGYAQYKEDKPGDERELEHEQSPEEIKADVQSLRDHLYNKYNFDHIKDQFDQKTFDKLMQDKDWKSSLIGERMMKRFGNDKNAWMKLMNLVAKNDNPYTLKFA